MVDVVVTNANQEFVEHQHVDKVFFINPATHSDAQQLVEYGEGQERVLFVNAALALTVELK